MGNKQVRLPTSPIEPTSRWRPLHRYQRQSSRSSIVSEDQRQSMLDVSIRSTEDEHSAFVTAAQMGCVDMVSSDTYLDLPINRFLGLLALLPTDGAVKHI